MKRGKAQTDDPATAEQWQEAVDVAAFLRALEDCKMYGLIEGGPKVSLDRCDELLEQGAKLGYKPAPMNDLIGRFLSPMPQSANVPEAQVSPLIAEGSVDEKGSK